MAPQAVEFDETTATPLPGAQSSPSVTFDDTTAVPLPKAAPVQPAADGANQPFSPADRALYTRPVNPGLATPPPVQQAQPNPSLQAPAAQRPVDTVEAAPPPTYLQRAESAIRNSVVGRALHMDPTESESELQRTGDRFSTPDLWPDWAKKPLEFSSPLNDQNDPQLAAEHAQARQNAAEFAQKHPKIAAIEEGVENAGGAAIQSLVTPETLAKGALASVVPAVIPAYIGQAASGIPDEIQAGNAARDKGDTKGATEHYVAGGIDAVTAAAMAYGVSEMARGGYDFPAGKPKPSVDIPSEPRALPAPPQPIDGEYIGEPAAPPQPGDIIEGEGIPILKPSAPAPAAQAPNLSQAEAALTGKPIEGVAPPAPTIQPSPDAERPPVQASSEPGEIRDSAQQQKPDLKQMATAVAQAVPGAEVVGPRVKSEESIDNKEERGKPVESNIDNLGVRVVAPNPDAVPAVQQAIEQSLPVVQKDKIDNNGLDIPQYGVKTGAPGDANQVSEMQVIPSPAVAGAMKDTDDLYAKQKEAIARGDKAEADRIGTQIQTKLAEANTNEVTEGGRAKAPEQAVEGRKPTSAAITKDAQVTLPDGSTGKVQHVNPNYSSGGRVVVQTTNGVKTFKGSELKPAESAQGPGPVGPPLESRVSQIQEAAAKGTPVKIFTARGDDPHVKQWLQQHGLGNLPVTNVKGHDFGALLDNEVNVPTNSDKPFEMPTVPAGKTLYVDLDGTLAKQPDASNQVEKQEVPAESKEVTNEQRVSTEQPAAAKDVVKSPNESIADWLEAYAGNDPEARRNATEKLARQSLQGKEDQPMVLGGEDGERAAVRTSSGHGEDSGAQAPAVGTRSPQEPRRIGQRTRESSTALSGRPQAAALSGAADAEKTVRKMVEEIRSLPAMRDRQVAAQRARDLQELFQSSRLPREAQGEIAAAIKEAEDALQQRERPKHEASSTSNPRGEEKANANEITSPAPRAVGERPESSPEVRGRNAEGGEAAGETAVERAGGKEDDEETKVDKPTKYKHGNTQADIPPKSDAGRALAEMRRAIDPDDLMGDGLVEDSHITVRYGIDGDDTSGIRAYLEKQPPFEASLGKTQAFPPSEHSDGAAPIVVPVESPDLRRMEKEIDKHGNFVERSFPEYKPHVTVAYVKPGEAKRYTGMDEASGKKFKVDSVTISKKDGSTEEAQLKGSTKPQFSAAARAKSETKPETKVERQSIVKERAKRNAELTEHFTPGNVIHSKYWNDYDKVLAFHPAKEGKSFSVEVVRSDKEGTPIEGERPRSHSTYPDKGDEIVKRSQPEEKPTQPVKTEADAVAPGTAPPSELEQWKAELAAEKAKGRQGEMTTAQLNALNAKILDAEANAHRTSIPLTEPEAKLVTDPDQNKWKYQAEYFVKALEPAKQAWIDRYSGRWSWDALVKPRGGPDGLETKEMRPKGFPDAFIRIEVPEDGKFLVNNSPAAIDKLLKSAPRAFAQPGKAPSNKRAVPRAPNELDPQALVDKHRAEIEETEQDLSRASSRDREFLQEKLKAARENLDEAERLQKEATGEPESGLVAQRMASLSVDERKRAAAMPPSAKASKARASIETGTPDAPTPSATLNAEAYSILRHDLQIGAAEWNGLTLSGDFIPLIATALRVKALVSGSIAGSRNLRGIAKKIEEAARDGKVLVLYAGEPGAKTAMEEQLHGWQISTRVHASRPIQDAVLKTAAAKALREGMAGVKYSPDMAVVVSEIAAKAVTGEMVQDGFTEEQRAEVLNTYFDAVAEHSPDSLAKIPEVSDEAKAAITAAKEKYGKSRETDSPDLRELHEPGGRSDEKGDEGSSKKTEPLAQLAKREPGDETGAGDRSSLASKIYSGFGDPELFKQLFPDVAQRIADWIKDPSGPGVEQKAMMRETRGQMDRRVAIAIHALKKEAKAWRTRSREDSIKFWNAVENGRIGSLAPKDQAVATIFRNAFDQMREEIQKLKPEVLQNYIENYWPHLWEKPSVVSNAIRRLLNGKRPFAGKASFLKKRTIPTTQEGLDLGFTPKTWNPVEQGLIKYAEMAQFLMAHQTLMINKNAGTAKYVRLGKRAPDGWVQADDRIGSVYRRAKILDEDKLDEATYEKTYVGGKESIPSVAREDVENSTQGATVLAGHYYMPAEAARVFNNFVSRGMAGRSKVYDTLNWLNQNLNALQLGISAFHASTTSINAATSDVALGIQQLAEGKPLKAGYSLAKGLTVAPSIIRTMVNGSHLLRQYLEPGSYAKMAKEAAALAQAGGRVRQNTIELKPLAKVINALRNGAVIEGLTSIPGAILHAVVAPVMDYYVPRTKLGAFYAMAHDILDEADRRRTPGYKGEIWDSAKVRARMQEAWDSIDNRFGQVVYDNLFWHKAVRDSLQLATRSVGWNFGSVRELGGAVTDTARGAGQAASGEVPRVTPRMAFAIALPIVSALIGGILHYLWTGKRPETWKDYFYPRTANGERHSIPGYMKDVFSFVHDPWRTSLNKLAPIWSLTAEAIENRDFYGTEIRHKDDPMMKQLMEFSSWAARQAIPFSFSGGAQLLKQRGAGPSLGEMLHAAKEHPGDVALGQLGFQPAPAFIQNSAAMNQAREYAMENRPPGTKTKEQADHYDAMDAVVQMYRTGDVDQKQIDDYVDKGVMTDKDVDKAERESDEDPLARAVKGLSVEQVLNVYEKGTPEEREAIEDYADHVRGAERREGIEDGIDKINGDQTVPPDAGGGA